MNVRSRIITIGVLFLLKFLFGFWLYRTGKPYNVAILTIHKLISLATLVSIVLTANNLRGETGMGAAQLGALITTIILFVLAIATGGLLSTDKTMPAIVAIIHKVAPFLSIVSTAATLYLLVQNR